MSTRFLSFTIRNGFKTLTIGTQNRQTRNKSLNIWNPTENDRLDSRAIIIINALRKCGVLLSDELICEKDEKKIQNFYHQIAVKQLISFTIEIFWLVR